MDIAELQVRGSPAIAIGVDEHVPRYVEHPASLGTHVVPGRQVETGAIISDFRQIVNHDPFPSTGRGAVTAPFPPCDQNHTPSPLTIVQ